MTAHAAGQIDCVLFDRADKSTRTLALAELPEALRTGDTFAWVDVHGTDLPEFVAVARSLGIEVRPQDHFGRPEILPICVERPDHFSFFMYEIVHPERHLGTTHGVSPLEIARLLVVLGDRLVLTFHRRPIDAVEAVREACPDAFRLAGRSPAFVVFLLLQDWMYDLAQLNLANDNYLDRLEELVIAPGETRLPADVGIAGRNILTLKRLTASLHIVLMRLGTRASPYVSETARRSFVLMLDNVVAIRGAVDSSRSLLDGILGAIQTEAANRTSEIARILTVISGVLLPVGVIAGIYGMNFQNMPELSHPYGYVGALGLMALVATVQLAAFWRLGWIGRRRGENEDTR